MKNLFGVAEATTVFNDSFIQSSFFSCVPFSKGKLAHDIDFMRPAKGEIDEAALITKAKELCKILLKD